VAGEKIGSLAETFSRQFNRKTSQEQKAAPKSKGEPLLGDRCPRIGTMSEAIWGNGLSSVDDSELLSHGKL
jgi:hypothetical protein